ncbi:MAG: prolyl oligopeptidase family serine peptidase [Bryobacteraceae bacterium]|nr:prolyl oligopeptidase family serine peptidase [Bryobacteraceae bacterium]
MRPFLVLALATLLPAQDAELVLRTAVAYTTQLGSLPLTDAQKAEAAKLGQQGQAAGLSGKFKEAMRNYTHGMAVMRGFTWTPAFELASSLQASVDDAIANPGQTLQLTFDRIFPVEQPTAAALKLILRPVPSGEPIPIEAPTEVKSTDLPLKIALTLPENATGNYNLIADLGDTTPNAAHLQKTVPITIAPVATEAQKLAARLKKQPLPAAEYTLVLYDHAEHGRANPHRFDFAKEFAQANHLLDTAATGKDPFAGRQGELHQAYRSTVDNTLQPYRVYVPKAYQGKPLPLVVALHGMGGDETSMMEGYGGTLPRVAERLGFFLVTPKGRGTASMYRDAAEKDVMDVLAEVERTYRIDPKRIYLMGHSMGGYGTWSIAMNHPDRFAALGPISGGGNAQGMEKIKHIPQYVVHGDNDKTVAVSQSRNMVEAGKKAGAKIEYIEVPGGSHTDIAVPNFGPMLEFFAKQSRE